MRMPQLSERVPHPVIPESAKIQQPTPKRAPILSPVKGKILELFIEESKEMKVLSNQIFIF